VFSFSGAFRALGPAATWRAYEIYGLPSDLRNANRQLPSVSELLIAATAICSLNSVYPPPLSAGDVTESRVSGCECARREENAARGEEIGDGDGEIEPKLGRIHLRPLPLPLPSPSSPAPLFCLREIVLSRGDGFRRPVGRNIRESFHLAFHERSSPAEI